MNVKYYISCYQKILKSRKDAWVLNLGLTRNTLTTRKGGIRCTQVRYNSTPSEATRIPPKTIPYVNPNFRSSRGGSKVLLIIPALTFGLGTWQVKRLKWKTELIKTMEERTQMEPVPLPLDPDEVSKMEFRKVTVTGRFDHSNEIFYGPKQCFVNGEVKRDVIHPSGQESFGYNLVTPFIVSETGQRILVNRGWIRTKTIKKKDRPWTNTKGEEMTITGVVRLPEPKRSYGPTVDDRYNIWHYRDIEDIANNKNCLPIWIDTIDDHSIPGKLWGGQTIMAIRNEHLQYIITWYSLSFFTAFMWYHRYGRRL